MSKPWSMIPLGEVLTKSDEWIDLRPDERYREVTVRLWGRGIAQRREVTGAEIAAAKRLVVHSQQFILSRIDARNGAFGIVPDSLEGAIVSNDFPVFTPIPERILPAFLGWMSRTRGFVNLCKAASEGTTNRVRLKEDRFLAMEISLPSLSEQQRIVARIEELAAKIDEARGLRRHATAELEHLVTRTAGEVFGGEKYQCERLGDLLREESRNGLSARPSDAPPGLRILRISAGTSRADGAVDEQDYKYLEVTDEQGKLYRLEPGDLLACRFNGNLHYVGRFSLFAGESGEPRLYPDKLIRFRVDRSRVMPEYVRSVMNSPCGRARIQEFCQTTAGNIGISAKNLNTIPVPVPPLEEQRRIVAYLDGLQAKVECLKGLQAQTAVELDAVLPSVLDKAFTGEL